MTFLKQNWFKIMETLQKLGPKKVIIGAFVLMFVVELFADTDFTISVITNLVVITLLISYGLYLLRHKDYVGLRFLFLILIFAKIISIAFIALDKLL